MRILLDENVPANLVPLLARHEVKTVPQMRWAGIKNGDLLRRTAGEFDVFLTIDHSIGHQQTLPASLAMLVLRVPNNRPESVLPLAHAILEALGQLQANQVVTIDGR